MRRKKLIAKLAIVAVSLAVLAGVGYTALFMHQQATEKEFVEKKKNKISELVKYYQDYLDETANKITQVPVDQQIISQISSNISKKEPVTKLYLWMSNSQGEFIFGSPNFVFERLNKAYEKYKTVIDADGYYLNKNDFFLKLVHRYEDIKWSQFDLKIRENEKASLKILGDKKFALGSRVKRNISRDSTWRFYKEYSNLESYWQPIRLELSVPVVDDNRQMMGTLYLKVDDYSVPTEYNNLVERDFIEHVLFPVCQVVFVASLFLLWFLLPSWVYVDAHLRSVKNPTWWALLAAFTLGFAWMIYLIVRPSELQSFHCPQCDKELNGTKAFCPYCGFDLSATFCPQCQYPIKPEWHFCPSCRSDLIQKPPEQTDISNDETK